MGEPLGHEKAAENAAELETAPRTRTLRGL